MRINNNLLVFIALVSMMIVSSCDNLLNPVQDIDITEDELLDNDWYEYRSLEMEMYALQQDLAEQLLVLGELRGDLLTITDNADADLVEIYNFNVTKGNKYASPQNFFKLISSCNNFIRLLEKKQPDVMDMSKEVTNYDRIYGEALCMRAWAYFDAVRIYGKVPFIPESLTTMEQINDFINTSGTYTDSVHIVYGPDGYDNDTTYNKDIELEKQYYDTKLVVNHFSKELEEKVKAVGVDHGINNNDKTWEVTVWNPFAMNTLLGLMNLTVGDLSKSAYYFDKIVKFPSEDFRYQLDQTFSNNNWKDIFTGININEHIYTIWFNKGNQQQNDFQRLFETRSPHEYMLKPTHKAVSNWETIWHDFRIQYNTSNPGKTILHPNYPGIPGDFYRGYDASYAYMRNGVPLEKEEIQEALNMKAVGETRSANLVTENVDTVVWKYSIGKDVYDQDANFIVYRAAGVHLWLAEVYNWWRYDRGSNVSVNLQNAESLVNDGSYFSNARNRDQLGVRGRVGFADDYNRIITLNIVYQRNPFTNEVTGYRNFTGDYLRLQKYFEDELIDEKAREMAFEGERFYDLMRAAKRRNDPSYLASKVAAKYPADQRDRIYNLLLNEENWYINYFE